MLTILFLIAISSIVFGYSLPGRKNSLIQFSVDLSDACFANHYHIQYSELYDTLEKEKEIFDILAKTETYKMKGYVYFSGTLISVHRWIMEEYILKHEMRPGQVVHHINGDKADNRIKNLQLFNSQEEHSQHHQNIQNNFGTWYIRMPEYANYQKFLEYAL
ncbi:MAG: HNH endonuclease [Patescibacteria group bacterium]